MAGGSLVVCLSPHQPHGLLPSHGDAQHTHTDTVTSAYVENDSGGRDRQRCNATKTPSSSSSSSLPKKQMTDSRPFIRPARPADRRLLPPPPVLGGRRGGGGVAADAPTDPRSDRIRRFNTQKIIIIKHTYSLHMWSRCRWRGRTASKPKTRSGFPSASPLSWSSTSSTSRREARVEVIPVVETKSNNPKDVAVFFTYLYIEKTK